MAQYYKKKAAKVNQKGSDESEEIEKSNKLELSKHLEDNICRIKNALNNSMDVRDRKFRVCGTGLYAAVIFVNSLVDEDTIQDFIIRPLMLDGRQTVESSDTKIDLDLIMNSLVSTSSVEEVHTFDSIVLAILSGKSFIAVEGCSEGLAIETQSLLGRNIDEPKNEPSVKGPKEAFVERLKDNLGLVRKRIKDPNLTFTLYMVGRRSKSDVVIASIKGITNESIVEEVTKRIKSINVDDGVSAGQVSQMISDSPNTIFPLTQVTERPDKVASALLEGRVAIIMNGAPNTILVPTTMPMLLQSVDDYYEQWILGSIIRLARYAGLFISALLPSLYIALTSFHPGILPTNITLSIAGTRAGVPFPAFIEALLMTVILEVLQEAGIRLPRVVGQTVSIVGGLVIGQAAVQAGVISPVMVIIIAITAISSFTIPDYSLNFATRVLRIPFMLLAVVFGAVGTSIGLLALLGYVCSLESFGVGYLQPLTPYRLRDWKDTLIRAPRKTFGKRPEFLGPEDTQRQIIRTEETADEED